MSDEECTLEFTGAVYLPATPLANLAAHSELTQTVFLARLSVSGNEEISQMGTFAAHIGVSDGNGGAMQWVDALVDTGATFTVLPDSVLREQVGVHPEETMEFTLADGRKAQFGVGEARLSVEGRHATSRVVFGEEDQYLVGATTLQVLGLIPDTTNHTLIPAPKLPI